jgi:ABC-type antimicrobial peptide transport system permease subunit
MSISSEYQNSIVIGLITAGFIIVVIPLLFFAVGEPTEKKVAKRELERYFSFWCKGTVGSLLQPRDIAEKIKTKLEETFDTPQQQERDNEVLEMNRRLQFWSYVISFTILIVIMIIANTLAYFVKSSFTKVYFEALLGTMLFIIIEVVMVVLLFSRYHPLDINFVNKYLVEKLL